jgi:Flp pilus assembly pilin Flp
MNNFIKNIHNNEDGTMAVEKILLLAIISIPIIILIWIFRNTISNWFNNNVNNLGNDPTNTN